MLNETCRTAMRDHDVVESIANYLVVIFEDGDAMNDYLASVPDCGQHLVLTIGQLLGYVIGF